jgi:hypothetical protein
MTNLGKLLFCLLLGQTAPQKEFREGIVIRKQRAAGAHIMGIGLVHDTQTIELVQSVAKIIVFNEAIHSGRRGSCISHVLLKLVNQTQEYHTVQRRKILYTRTPAASVAGAFSCEDTVISPSKIEGMGSALFRGLSKRSLTVPPTP